jgi:hypothetical protein
MGSSDALPSLRVAANAVTLLCWAVRWHVNVGASFNRRRAKARAVQECVRIRRTGKKPTMLPVSWRRRRDAFVLPRRIAGKRHMPCLAYACAHKECIERTDDVVFAGMYDVANKSVVEPSCQLHAVIMQKRGPWLELRGTFCRAVCFPFVDTSICACLPVIDRVVPYLIRSAILHSPPTRISACFLPIHVDQSCDLQILHPAVQPYIIINP